MSDPAAHGGVFEESRHLLFAVAYRILGTVADAEDAMQDAWLKWSAADRSRVADPRAYLMRIVANVALDRLRTVKARRETYVGPWLPEPIVTSGGADPESVSMALLVLLENLSPLERAVFVLREAFSFTYAEIAEAVERSEDSVRQAAHRARDHVTAARPRFRPTRQHHREVTERFLAAATGGDINGLLALLAPDVALWTDGGGRVRQAMRPVVGAPRVASWLAGVGARPYEGVHPTEMTADLVDVNGAPALVFRGAGRVIGTLSLDLNEDGLVVAVHNVANPDKLRDVTARTVHLMDVPTAPPT